MLIIWTSGAASRVRYSVVMSYSGSATANAKMCLYFFSYFYKTELIRALEPLLHRGGGPAPSLPFPWTDSGRANLSAKPAIVCGASIGAP